MKKFWKEFKTFISRGNVMDMAVGIECYAYWGSDTELWEIYHGNY